MPTWDVLDPADGAKGSRWYDCEIALSKRISAAILFYIRPYTAVLTRRDPARTVRLNHPRRDKLRFQPGG